MSNLFVGELRYIKTWPLYCSVQNSLHSLESDGTSNHENCEEWCNDNANCRNFRVYRNTCYFRSDESCYDDPQPTVEVVVFTKKGT